MKTNINKLFITLSIALALGACNTKTPKSLIKPIDTVVTDIPYEDTVEAKYSYNSELFELARVKNIAQDSLNECKDSIDLLNAKIIVLTMRYDSLRIVNVNTKEKLGIAEYKLLRIREYNRIAAQGNNLKFLRGWIIRTLNH